MAEQRTDLRPVQVFLDTKRFITTPEPQRRPRAAKDFFKGNDAGFVDHKKRMTFVLTVAAAGVRRAKVPSCVVQVKQRPEALAKSHRPMNVLFSEANGFSFVGTESSGELLFQGAPSALDYLAQLIEDKAELTPKSVLNKRNQEMELKVSPYRSELGGIDDLRLHGAQDKVRFSAQEAVEWLSQENVIGGYLVELFRPAGKTSRGFTRALVEMFNVGLAKFQGGMIMRPFLPPDHTAAFGEPPLALTVLLTKKSDRLIDLPFDVSGSPAEISEASLPETFRHREVDLDVGRHHELLTFLAEQSLVRSVSLPPVLETTPSAAGHVVGPATLVAPVPNVSYPVVGIIDGGISSTAGLAPWKVGDAGLVPASDRDEQHGTFIAGLVSSASKLNPSLAQHLEDVGCKYYDLDLFPRRDLRSRYYADIEELFDVLEEKVKVAKRDLGVRVFNLSFSFGARISRFAYSLAADRLDRLARANDVLFVVAAGNAKDARPPWPENPSDLTAMLASHGNGVQQLTTPGEHVLGLTVGAVNPYGIAGHVATLPTTYTCRGPGVGGSPKPELSHFGGARVQGTLQTGLISVTDAGSAAHNCGTSYAAPLAASTLATLDHRLEHQAGRETLMALAVHRAKRASALDCKSVRHIARDFVGFGMTPPADVILSDQPHSITLVFSDRLLAKQVLDFPFAWPQSLVKKDGSCRGQVDVTLCFTPPIDPQHRDESIRVQIEAQLSQEAVDEETGEVIWDGHLTHDSGIGSRSEQALIRDGLKWSPIKRYNLKMPKGRGTSSNWRLSLNSLVRAGEVFPSDGVPFSLVVTISDITEKERIGEEIRQALQGRGFQLVDITVAHRVRQRGR